MIRTFLLYKLADLCIDAFFSMVSRNLSTVDLDKAPTPEEIRTALHHCLKERNTDMIDDSLGTCLELAMAVVIYLKIPDKYFDHVYVVVTMLMKEAFNHIKKYRPDVVRD